MNPKNGFRKRCGRLPSQSPKLSQPCRRHVSDDTKISHLNVKVTLQSQFKNFLSRESVSNVHVHFSRHSLTSFLLHVHAIIGNSHGAAWKDSGGRLWELGTRRVTILNSRFRLRQYQEIGNFASFRKSTPI
ncbi:MAG TPA: hypothetical protein VH678_08730 [Xanthobacteraceae bacterium]|jgi:hypothetical protein